MRDFKLSAITLLVVIAAACACTFQSPPSLRADGAAVVDAGVPDVGICEGGDATFLLANYRVTHGNR